MYFKTRLGDIKYSQSRMSLFWNNGHKHDWWPLAVKYGTSRNDGSAETVILQRCQDDACGRFTSDVVHGTWNLDEVRRITHKGELAELKRIMKVS